MDGEGPTPDTVADRYTAWAAAHAPRLLGWTWPSYARPTPGGFCCHPLRAALAGASPPRQDSIRASTKRRSVAGEVRRGGSPDGTRAGGLFEFGEGGARIGLRRDVARLAAFLDHHVELTPGNDVLHVGKLVTD
jgi:hypothetical protein